MTPNGSAIGSKTPPPKLSATFVPGDHDNYLMPVISPIPQRSMPEVPDQIQQNLAKLELDSRPISPPSASTSSETSRGQHYGQRTLGVNDSRAGLGISDSRQPLRSSPGVSPRVSPIVNPQANVSIPSQSILSSEPFFPHIKNPPPNIPARADETEHLLESARLAVLSSNDVESQITWAQDALAYVFTAIENNARLADAGIGRSKTPSIERQLRVDALQILNFLADQHHPKAEFLRGMWLEFGRFDYQVDKPQAYRCFSTSARNGYARAEYRLGMQFEETGELDKALRHYNIGVQKLDAASHYRMGMMHLLGQNGQRHDVQRGLDYIRFSADNADDNAPQGSYIYGMLLAKELPQVSIPDQILPRDITQAKYYLEKAAYLGFSHAQTRMGSAYELQQLNCDFDPVYSLHYNRLAARQGESEAEMAISKWFLSGYDGIFPKNEAVAYEYALRAAQSGFPTAEFAMGYFNEVGIHVQSNLAEAKVWYGRAAEHGSEDARGRITGISRSKTLSRKDHDSMALAKIKSVRGRPTAKQQNLQMPQIDSYRQPSPSPSTIPPNNISNPPYRREQQQSVPPQGTFSNPNINYPGGRADPSAYSLPSGTHMPQTHSVPPSSTAYAQPPPGENLQPASYSNRQSSLPQGYRLSSQPLLSATSPNRPNFGNINKPTQSPQPNSGSPAPTKTSYTADIGYSAPVDLRGAERRRIASGAARPPASGVYSTSGVTSNRIPTPASQASQAIPAASRPQPKPTVPAQSSSVVPTAPTKTSSAPVAGKKPGKGPATFAEMGIPQAKTDSDCIVM